MYARLIIYRTHPGPYADAGNLAQRFVPAFQRCRGFRNAVFFGDEATGEYGIFVLWRSREDVEVEATTIIPRLQEALTGLALENPVIRVYEVDESICGENP